MTLNYLRSWFFVDLISVIPFDVLFSFGNINKVARFTRIGKIYRLLKMTKIVRLVKIIKVENKIIQFLEQMLKIGAGTERLIYLLVTYFVLLHVTCCVW